jgi:response regulator RpfG family c-di-GMP phosphodiesterase
MLNSDLKKLVAQYGGQDGGPSNVLIVDDERPNLMVLRGFLDADYTVHEALSGPEALRIASEHELSVVIADQRMPGMTGIEMLEKLRQIQPDAVGIVVTGYTDTPALMSAINEAHVFRFLKKPWQPEEVLAAVRIGCQSAFQARALRNLVGLSPAAPTSSARRSKLCRRRTTIFSTSNASPRWAARLGRHARPAQRDDRVNHIERNLRRAPRSRTCSRACKSAPR